MEKGVEEVVAQVDLTNDDDGDDNHEANSVTQIALTGIRNSKKQKKVSPAIGNPSLQMLSKYGKRGGRCCCSSRLN